MEVGIDRDHRRLARMAHWIEGRLYGDLPLLLHIDAPHVEQCPVILVGLFTCAHLGDGHEISIRYRTPTQIITDPADPGYHVHLHHITEIEIIDPLDAAKMVLGKYLKGVTNVEQVIE